MYVYSVLHIFSWNFSENFYSALHALLTAIDPQADGKLTSELSDKLSELVGPEVIESFKQGRNERGEVWCCTPMS